MARWLIMFLVGLGVALVAVAVAMMIEYAAHLKFSILQKCILWEIIHFVGNVVQCKYVHSSL